GISLAPGENSTYTIEVLNSSSEVKTLNLGVENVPEQWNYNITANGFALSEISVKPGESEEFTVDVEVPLQIEKGTYNFSITGTDQNGTTTRLPISINVEETGVFKTELTSEQTNM